MLLNNPLLTLFVVVLLTLIMLFSSLMLKQTTKHFIVRQKLVGKLNAYTEEMMEGARVVQVFNHQDTAIKEFYDLSEEYRLAEMKGNMIGNVIGPLFIFFLNSQN